MSDAGEFEVGAVSWFDLTVSNASEIRDFYKSVVGWESNDHDMGEYADFDIVTPEKKRVVTGICHARGLNADIPSGWLLYVNVADVDASVARCRELGGSVVAGPRRMGRNPFCVIRDPAGALLALVGPPAG